MVIDKHWKILESQLRAQVFILISKKLKFPIMYVIFLSDLNNKINNVLISINLFLLMCSLKTYDEITLKNIAF